MKPCKHPISHALTSFNGVSADKDEASAVKPVAKIHHLPTSILKKKEEELRNALDLAIEKLLVYENRERLAADTETDDGSAAKIREMHPFRAFNLLKAASRFTQAELVQGLGAVHAADLALKTTGQPEGLILEMLAVTLCGGEAHTS